MPAFIALLSSLTAGCANEPKAPSPSPVLIDERRGMIDGVGIGDSLTKIRRVLNGSSRQGDVRAFPDNLGFTGRSLSFPGDYSVRDRVQTLRYRDRSFVGTRRSGAYGVFIWNPRARTRAGVQIGDDLEFVAKRYASPRCDEEVIDDGPDRAKVCTVRVGRRTIAFSGDPIKGVTLATSSGR